MINSIKNSSFKQDSILFFMDDLTTATWILALGTLAVAIATIITIITNNKKQDMQIKLLDKQNQTTAMLEVFKLLNSEEHRLARKWTYQAFRGYKIKLDRNIFGNRMYYRYVEMVRADFDHLGSLIINELVPKKMFFDVYASTVIICWKVLEVNIEDERTKRNTQTYMIFFDWLRKEAEIYWKETYSNIPEPEPY